MRAGGPSDEALTAGAFGIGAGLEGWHYSREVGASGDDYTSLLALPAGSAPARGGVVTLWRSRRLDEGLPRRYLRRTLVGIAGLLVALVVVVPVVYSYGLTHLGRPVVPEPDLGADFEDVSFTTDDGLELPGLVRPVGEPRRGDPFPGARARRPARMLIRTGTACCCSTAAARATARVTRTRSAGTATGT